ncbi:peptide/nickel transport system permease protein [Antricoccus suffuscus]|uniref:Peptide/nickel transport system permease protein n=1 Tax=Antricoccus suffuscus TaxID=1629062 RepID=A0A2T1A6J9_9ACTN|nr:ABC transporter permease [Antricoccus suffuscus]PRZ44233.1 peptide/nickel transport system permease protein [Antricoccus suffuscus]
MDSAVDTEPRNFGATRRSRRRPKIGLIVAVAVLALVLLAAIFAPWVAPHSPLTNDLPNRLAGPSASHWLGTDQFGRDVLSRLIWGGRNAFGGVAIAIGVTLVVGIPWGTVAGYFPKYVGTTLMRVADTVIAFPTLVLAIAITGSLGAGLVTSMIAIGLVFSPKTAQLTRAGVLALRSQEFVLSARLGRVRMPIIVIRHILPIALRPVVVQVTIYTGLAFVIQGVLAFLGLGPQRPTPSWGSDLSDGYAQILSSPGQIIAPGLLLGIVVMCVYRVGDALRDRMSAGALDDQAAKDEVVVA